MIIRGEKTEYRASKSTLFALTVFLHSRLVRLFGAEMFIRNCKHSLLIGPILMRYRDVLSFIWETNCVGALQHDDSNLATIDASVHVG